MADKSEESKSDDKAKAPEAPPAAARKPIEVNTDATHSAYSNFCRVTGTPEELIVDFGLNPQPIGPSTTPVNISQRIILNYFTAKRLLGALQVSIQRHEAAFGVLETDVQKRVQPSARQ
jgi:hypothetical protein